MRCNVCLDDNCKNKSCDCTKCKHIKECDKVLSPIIRITDKCTQSCSHCCFSCSPKGNKMMTIEMAKNIKQFLTNNNILMCTIMGGEFFMNPDWKEIFDIIIPGLIFVRLVTNGDWAENQYIIDNIKYENLKISISKDKWHTNKLVDKAIQVCIDKDIKYNVTTTEEATDECLVPVGRVGWGNFYSMFGQYCQRSKYSFLIDEAGEIYKCGFGIWKYASVNEYLDGEFDKRFKEFNLIFYSTFIPNCASCIRSYNKNKITSS